MATRNSRADSDRAFESISDLPSRAVAVWADLPRRQAALWTYSTTALFRGTQDLMRINMQQATQYWGEVARAALQLQADMVSSAGEAVAQGASEPTLESLQRAFEATLNGTAAGTAAH